MTKTPVKLLIINDGNNRDLAVQLPDGSIEKIEVYNGGGYVTQLTLTHTNLGETIKQAHVKAGGAVTDLATTESGDDDAPV